MNQGQASWGCHCGERLSSGGSFLAKSHSKFLEDCPLLSQGLVDNWQLSIMMAQMNTNEMQKIISLL